MSEWTILSCIELHSLSLEKYVFTFPYTTGNEIWTHCNIIADTILHFTTTYPVNH